MDEEKKLANEILETGDMGAFLREFYPSYNFDI